MRPTVRKILSYTGIALSTSLLVISSSPYLMEKTQCLFPYMYRFGDQYTISNLAQYKTQLEDCEDWFINKPKKPKTHLYIIGDSFTIPCSEYDFVSETYSFKHWESDRTFAPLDSTARNILIIESVERYARPRLAIIGNCDVKIAKPDDKPYQQPLKHYINLENEENLGYTMTHSDVALWFKETKAAMTQTLFGRIQKECRTVEGSPYMFYYEGFDVTHPMSSFHPVPDEQVTLLAEQFANYKKKCEKLGFTEVYLSVIPNKESIVLSDRTDYNHFIERLEAALPRRATLDAYNALSEIGPDAYYKGDAHWTCKGRKTWLEHVNEIIMGETFAEK